MHFFLTSFRTSLASANNIHIKNRFCTGLRHLAMLEILDHIFEFYGSFSTSTKVLFGIAALVISSCFIFWRTKRCPSLLKTDYKTGVVYLYQFPRTLVIPSLSSYCLKLETWLRMADINYENVDCSPMTRSSQGLLPFIEFNGKQIVDSGFIIKELTKVFNNNELESYTTIEQKACARAFEKMIENSTTQSNVYFKWILTPQKHFSEKIHGPLPLFFKLPFARWALTRGIKQRLISHGIGRHNVEDIISIGLDDLKALSDYIGPKKFFAGDQPKSIDAALFGLLAQIVYIPIESPYKDLLKNECKYLIEYCDRMKDRFWPDWNQILIKVEK